MSDLHAAILAWLDIECGGPKTAEAIRVVLDIHKPTQASRLNDANDVEAYIGCADCDDADENATAYPCMTVTAIAVALGVAL